jgi:hypothetical protein
VLYSRRHNSWSVNLSTKLSTLLGLKSRSYKLPPFWKLFASKQYYLHNLQVSNEDPLLQWLSPLSVHIHLTPTLILSFHLSLCLRNCVQRAGRSLHFPFRCFLPLAACSQRPTVYGLAIEREKTNFTCTKSKLMYILIYTF